MPDTHAKRRSALVHLARCRGIGVLPGTLASVPGRRASLYAYASEPAAAPTTRRSIELAIATRRGLELAIATRRELPGVRP